ncbi:MAG: NAD(P)H-dependent oxidoreductase [Parasporobacterium sp.]|nr:NAD(P)H-dependent oxidoreductase [Parasporobacterium sp.]
MILYINACVREESRTRRLTEKLIETMEGSVEEVRLADLTFPQTTESFLAHRDELIADEQFDVSMFDLARQFAAADQIIIAAPYWDLSFPAALKQYFEQINVVGITFKYSPEGIPVGLCHASKLYYVMTAGGNYVPEEFGFGYVKALAQGFYGIGEVELIKAIGLDIVGADAEGILSEACRNIMK